MIQKTRGLSLNSKSLVITYILQILQYTSFHGKKSVLSCMSTSFQFWGIEICMARQKYIYKMCMFTQSVNYSLFKTEIRAIFWFVKYGHVIFRFKHKWHTCACMYLVIWFWSYVLGNQKLYKKCKGCIFHTRLFLKTTTVCLLAW